ncbi:MAG: hypothetical protein WCP30_15510 [Mycobacteriaceae bacterium]
MTIRVSSIWLKAASVVTILTGVICALASHSSTGGLWLYLFDALKWPIDGDPAVFNADTRAVNAVLGGVMVGWGLLMFFLSSERLMTAAPNVPPMMTISLLAWFLVDSAGSWAAGLPGNIALNVAFLAMFLPPLASLSRRVSGNIPAS